MKHPFELLVSLRSTQPAGPGHPYLMLAPFWRCTCTLSKNSPAVVLEFDRKFLAGHELARNFFLTLLTSTEVHLKESQRYTFMRLALGVLTNQQATLGREGEVSVAVHQVCIVGLGMMGGAVGMAARRAGVAARVTGVADSADTIERARVKGAVDDATLDLRAAVRDADLVVLCVPVRTILDAANAVIPACREGTVITDIGSSKNMIVRQVEILLHKHKSRAFFVGSHPVAGSEKKGIEAADQVNLSGAPCVITPTPHTDIEAYRRVEEFWKALGLRTLRLAPDEHDAVLARSSHLPHILASALVSIQTDRSLEISGPGLRDMTRLAGSDPAMWADIAEQNAPEIAKACKELGQELLRLSQEIEALGAQGMPGAEAARERLFRFLADARQRHEKRYLKPEKPAAPETETETEEGAGPESSDLDNAPVQDTFIR